MNRKMLVIHAKDNVGILLESAVAGDVCDHEQKIIRILEDTDFAHKIALSDISQNAVIYKYGEEIGYALVDIKRGQWVHNHNMGCRRGK